MGNRKPEEHWSSDMEGHRAFPEQIPGTLGNTEMPKRRNLYHRTSRRTSALFDWW